MKLQLLSDLHLETESFDPEPAPGAELLVLAGDICSRWHGYERFAGWPVPVLVVAGNHEFDGRDFDAAAAGLRGLCQRLGFVMLERESLLFTAADGQRIRVLGSTRWSDFDLYGAAQRERAQRASEYFMRLMAGQRAGRALDAAAVRDEALVCRGWLETELQTAPQGRWNKTLVVTHFAPSLRSMDTRYGAQPGTASFCNADDDLIPRADLWLHGHLHCRHDYLVPRAGRRPSRVVCNARGLAGKGEDIGHRPLLTLEL
ncbi:MAG: metallophosphoesterase [Rubrivivax sp.]|nr:metallophosphoesterase [Rubrivivax sp.]